MNNISEPWDHLSSEKKRALLAQLLQKKAAQAKPSYPLSYGQQALWFLYQSTPESAAYNTAFTARIRSHVDIPALQRTFQTLVNRHSSLRTTFSTDDNGEPVQVVHGYQEICFNQIDASIWTWDELYKEVVEAYRRPFNLERGPVFRVTLFTRSEQDHILLLAFHHIIYDGWSLWILLDELRVLYSAEKFGSQVSLPSLRLSYTDYVRKQAEMLAGLEGEKSWNYWQRQLSGELPVLNLPTDRPRPPVQTNNGASYPFKLSEGLIRKMKEVAQAEGVTLYMLLLAAFQVLIHRYTGQEDILVGSPIAGRDTPELAGIFGYFINMVVLRANLSGNPTFKTFLQQVRQTVLDMIAHQNYPFPLLVEKLQPKRDASRSPLFQVTFILQRAQRSKKTVDWLVDFLYVPGSEHPELQLSVKTEESLTNNETIARVDWGDLTLEPFAISQEEGQFDLSLQLAEAKGSLMGAFQYNTDLFDMTTIVRMTEHFRTLLEGIVDNQQQRVSELPILTEVERHQILVEWNNIDANYPKDKCLHELFEAQVERTPDAVALRFEDQQLTYRELNSRANQLAHYLQALGVRSEVLVGICVERSLEMVVGLLGILKAGGTYVPLDPAYPLDRLAFMVEDTQMPVLLTQQQLFEKLPSSTAKVVCLDTDWEKVSQKSQKNPINKGNTENLAYIIYTSGSTGKPKGVQISHRALVNFLYSMCHCPGFTDQDILLAVTTISFDIAGLELYLPLIVGGQIVLASQEEASDGKKLFEKLLSSNATIMQATPVSWRLLLSVGWEGESPLKILCGGEALPRELANQLATRSSSVWNMYGPTETTIWSTLKKIESSERMVSIGRPIANTEIYILDSYLQPVPIGVAGELYIGGDGLSRGYFKRPDLTKEKFIPHPFSDESGSRLYKTGDLARYLPDGNIEFLGRSDHQVKIRGFRIELGEIEAILTEHPAVRDVVVIAREDQPGDSRLAAYVVEIEGEGHKTEATELRKYLKKKLPDYMIPSAFVMLETLPLTPNGKVDRRALPAPERSGLEKGYVAPRTHTEEVLTKIWTEVLGLKQVGIHDNFFELGGHSLLATQLISRTHKEFQVDIPVHKLFEEPTVATLAEYIETIQWLAQEPSISPDVTESKREEIEI